MTLQEALALAIASQATAKANPKHRRLLTKRQASSIAKRLSAGADTLNKRFNAMSGTLAEMQKQLDRARAGVSLYANAMKINLTETMQ